MKRRDFSALVVGGSALGLTPQSQAQGSYVEGQHYVKVSPAAPVSAPAGKVEVVEFFWYGCPHCNALEPTLEPWAAKLPADVAFRRVPVAFGAIHEAHQRMFYALEAMGALDKAHKAIFAAMHVQRQRLANEEEQIKFLAGLGIDGAKYSESLKSFSVLTKARQAKQLSEAYKIEGVPSLGVQGKFLTGGNLAGSNEAALKVVDFLVAQVRKGG